MAKTIRINQALREVDVNTSFINKIYTMIYRKETFNESNINLNASTLIGEITLNYYTYKEWIDKVNEYFPLLVVHSNYYIMINDPEVLRIYNENNISSDGIGIIPSDFDKQINASFFDNFYENENIVDCSSFEYFTNISGSFRGKNGPFYNCVNLKRIILPQPISELNKSWYEAKGIFENCSSLEYCKITNTTITELGHGMFRYCSNPNLKIDLKNVPIHIITRYCLASTKIKSLETCFLNYDFNNLQKLYAGSMAYNDTLESFTVYSNISYIGDYAFAECTNLTSFTVIENGVDIGLYGNNIYGPSGAIFYRTNISRIDFYSRVTKMENLVFGNITTELIFRNTTPPDCSVGSSSIFRHFQGKIYVPDDKIDVYKAADGFSTVASKIYGISELI